MKIKCNHGYFRFYEIRVGEISNLIKRTGFDLVSKNDYFTFSDLIDAPRYSLEGKILIDIPAIKSFEGEEWEIFEQNNVVYDFTTGFVVPIASIITRTKIEAAGNRYLVTNGGLLLPGSITTAGKVKGYSAWYSSDRQTFLYSEVSFV